jgi:hypothetical protein
MLKKMLLICFALFVWTSNADAVDSLKGFFVYNQTIKRDNAIVLEFLNKSNNKFVYFDALKSNLKPYIFYTTDIGGNIITNEKLKNLHFILEYNKWPNDSKVLYINSAKEI